MSIVQQLSEHGKLTSMRADGPLIGLLIAVAVHWVISITAAEQALALAFACILIAPLMTMILIWQARQHSAHLQVRRSWHLLFISYLIGNLANLLWISADLLGFRPLQTIGDIVFLAAYLWCLPALIRYQSGSLHSEQRVTFWLDTAIVITGSLLLIWHVVLIPITASLATPSFSLWNLIPPMIDSVVLCLLIALLIRAYRFGSSLVLLMLIDGFALTIFANLLYAQGIVLGSYQSGLSIIDSIYISSAGLVGYAAYRSFRVEQPAISRVYTVALLPSLIVLLSFLWFAVGVYQLAPTLLSLILAMASLLVLFVIRQVFAMRDNQRLLRESATLTNELARSAARFRALVQNASDVISVIDGDGLIRYDSPAIRRLLGYDSINRINMPFEAYVHPDDRQTLRQSYEQVQVLPSTASTTEIRMSHSNGSWRWIEISLTNLRQEPSIAGIVANYRDVTDRRRFVEQLWQQATHDPLTGLANRALFQERVEVAILRKHPVAVLLLDLDGFKTVNDSLGHAAGDQLLLTVADRLGRLVGQNNLIARLGGDEFGILIEGDVSTTAACIAADRVIEALREPIQIEGKQLFALASIGIALNDYEVRDGDELLRNADAAMYSAKGRGRGSYALFTPGLYQAALDRLELESDLPKALEQNQFVLHYQPIFDAQSGICHGFEALIRWEHPRRGLLKPARFIHLITERGMSVPVSMWVLREACQQMQYWSQHTYAPFVTVNIAIPELSEANFAQRVAELLKEIDLPAQQLKFEITEEASVDDVNNALLVLQALKQLGIQLAFDDFGTGRTALSYITTFPIDLIKIDRSFVRQVDSHAETYRLVHAIVTLAHTIGIKTVAEGVETQTQADALRALGCDMLQGFLFAPGLPADQAVAFLGQPHSLSQKALPEAEP
ncbi:MAG: hypothetical protein Fur005_32530 [Roseiflexaceae bacterium]